MLDRLVGHEIYYFLDGYFGYNKIYISLEDQEWIINSGYTFHMTPRRDWFVEMNEAASQVILGDGKTCNIEGIATIRLLMADGTSRLLADVRSMPIMKRNLIYLGTLAKNGFSYKGEADSINIMKGSSSYCT